jgi:hypothetical protein
MYKPLTEKEYKVKFELEPNSGLAVVTGTRFALRTS